MITEKKVALKPILESSEGIHVTIYLVNRGDLFDLRSQLRDCVHEAYEWLQPVQTLEERKKFLEPFDALLKDTRIFKNMKGNIGLFRNTDSFRVLNIPVELERQCHVASSFHVKPLLRWMQFDREFLVLGIKSDSAHLYFGNQNTVQKVESILFPDEFKKLEALGDYQSLKRSKKLKAKHVETFSWLSDWIDEVTVNASPKLFLAGDQFMVQGLLRKLKYKNVVTAPVAPAFTESNLSDVVAKVRVALKQEARKTLERVLLEFHFAEELNLAKKNIFQIAKAAVRGKVKKLIVAEGINVFGKVDKKTGGVAIHPFDLDHADDDILDDLAQTVLASGGEVVVVPKSDIPKSRPILAILEHDGSGLQKSRVYQDYEALKERMAE